MQKTVSLGTAKMLVEKGIKIKSELWWQNLNISGGLGNVWFLDYEGTHPAPDISELLAELPPLFSYDENEYIFTIDFEDNAWSIYWLWYDMRYTSQEFCSEELVEALAQALIWAMFEPKKEGR